MSEVSIERLEERLGALDHRLTQQATSLCQKMELIIKTLQDTTVLRFKAIEDNITARDKALDKQAVEYERRLHDLNGEAARLLDAIKITVSQDTWVAFLKEYEVYKDQTDREFTAFKDATAESINQRVGRAQGINMSASFAVGIIVAVAAVFGMIGGAVALLIGQ